MENLHDLLTRLRARADNAYIEYLDAHCIASEKLGRHKTLMEVCHDIEAALEAAKE